MHPANILSQNGAFSTLLFQTIVRHCMLHHELGVLRLEWMPSLTQIILESIIRINSYSTTEVHIKHQLAIHKFLHQQHGAKRSGLKTMGQQATHCNDCFALLEHPGRGLRLIQYNLREHCTIGNRGGKLPTKKPRCMSFVIEEPLKRMHIGSSLPDILINCWRERHLCAVRRCSHHGGPSLA
jgi:hypothetical protein